MSECETETPKTVCFGQFIHPGTTYTVVHCNPRQSRCCAIPLLLAATFPLVRYHIIIVIHEKGLCPWSVSMSWNDDDE